MARKPQQSRRRLLVVDDSRLILKMVRDFFKPHGYTVSGAEDAAQGLKQLEKALPDVIVADILMPGMDGWQFYEEVKKRPESADIPFVFLTTETDLPQRLRGLRLGADDYITKPFAVEELHARVERILNKREALRQGWASGQMLLAGAVEHLAISDLLQILSLNGKDAVVQLRQGEDEEEEGKIVFESGRLVHAGAGMAKGKKALYRMLGWPNARFRVLPLQEEVPEKTLDLKTTDALMDGLVSLDEWNRWSDSLPDRDTRLEFVDDARACLENEQVTAAEFDVMARSKDGLRVGQILEESQLPDGEVAQAICTLLTRGVLRPVP